MSDSPSSVGDITLMALLKSGFERSVSEDAATQFYSRYMEKLMSLVQRNLASRFSSRVDPEDLVQSIFRSWFRRAKEDRIQPSSRDEVWKLLSVMALNKVRNKVKFHDAQRRAVGKTTSDEVVLAGIPEPTAEDATQFLELVQKAGSQLDDKARQTLELILEGRSVSEIATTLGRTTKSIQRYKDKIGIVLRSLLDDDLQSAGGRSLDESDDDDLDD